MCRGSILSHDARVPQELDLLTSGGLAATRHRFTCTNIVRHFRKGGRRRSMLVMAKPLVDFPGSQWKSSWKTGSLKRIGHFLHLTHKTPGASCTEVECSLASRRKIGDRLPPFGEQIRI